MTSKALPSPSACKGHIYTTKYSIVLFLALQPATELNLTTKLKLTSEYPEPWTDVAGWQTDRLPDASQNYTLNV